MNLETRALLDAVRTAEDPTPEDERRVLAAVQAAVATGAIVGAGTFASKVTKLFAGGLATGAKVGGVVLGLSAAAWIAVTATAPTPPVAVAPRPTFDARPPKNDVPRAPLPSKQVTAPTLPQTSSNANSRAGTRREPAASASHATPSLRDEIALLAEVQAALSRGDGARALQKLDQHSSGDARLLAERRAARILALCALGRTSEAGHLAELFHREHPTSVQRTSVERSCAGKATPSR